MIFKGEIHLVLYTSFFTNNKQQTDNQKSKHLFSVDVSSPVFKHTEHTWGRCCSLWSGTAGVLAFCTLIRLTGVISVLAISCAHSYPSPCHISRLHRVSSDRNLTNGIRRGKRIRIRVSSLWVQPHIIWSVCVRVSVYMCVCVRKGSVQDICIFFLSVCGCSVLSETAQQEWRLTLLTLLQPKRHLRMNTNAYYDRCVSCCGSVGSRFVP